MEPIDRLIDTYIKDVNDFRRALEKSKARERKYRDAIKRIKVWAPPGSQVMAICDEVLTTPVDERQN